MIQDYWANAIFSVTPTILIGLVFWFAMRAIIRSDRGEREAFSKIEADERAKHAAAKGATAENPEAPAA